jgi:hypothetical protein
MLLAVAAQRHQLSISEIARTPEEQSTGAPARSMRITAVDGQPPQSALRQVADVVRRARTQPAPFRPRIVDVTDGVLTIGFSAPSPVGLLQPAVISST